jgi:hypothetical protein
VDSERKVNKGDAFRCGALRESLLVQHSSFGRPTDDQPKRRNRRLFVTTATLDSAMAAPA